MAENLLSTIVALLIALLSNSAGSVGDTDSRARSAPPQIRPDAPPVRDLSSLRTALRDAVREFAAGVIASTASERPSLPDAGAREKSESPAGADGCHTRHASGDGWATTTIRCSQRSEGSGSETGSEIVISSSSVSVSSTSSDDAP